MINCELGMCLRAVITNYETELGSGSASLHGAVVLPILNLWQQPFHSFQINMIFCEISGY